VLCKTEDERNAKMLAQRKFVWLLKATHNSVAPADHPASLGQSLFRIPVQVDLSSYLE